MNSTSERLLNVGDYAPDFTLDADNDEQITLSKLRGKNIILYFYPKDDTPGCTKEAQQFSELNEHFLDYDAVIIGISKDTVKKHKSFKEKYCLPFTLVSDKEGSVCEAYNTWVEKNMYGRKYMGIQRDTYLIDKKGIIKEIWRKVKVDSHARAVFEKLQEIA